MAVTASDQDQVQQSFGWRGGNLHGFWSMHSEMCGDLIGKCTMASNFEALFGH